MEEVMHSTYKSPLFCVQCSLKGDKDFERFSKKTLGIF
jgi:hypothetical protein